MNLGHNLLLLCWESYSGSLTHAQKKYGPLKMLMIITADPDLTKLSPCALAKHNQPIAQIFVPLQFKDENPQIKSLFQYRRFSRS